MGVFPSPLKKRSSDSSIGSTPTMSNHSTRRAVDITNSNGNTVYSVAFTPDGKHVVGGDGAGGIHRWTIEDAQQIGASMTANVKVNTIAVSKDGKWVVTGHYDGNGKVTVWNSTTHQKALDIPYMLNYVWAVDIAGDSARLAAGSGEKTVQIFGITSGTQLISPLQHDSTVIGLKFSPAGDRIATATYDHPSVRIYNSHSGEKLFDIPVRVKGYPVTPLAWSPDGRQLFAASPGRITCVDTSSSARSEWLIPDEHSHVSVVTNGKFVACSAGTSLTLWDAISHKQIGGAIGHAAEIQCISLSPDEGCLASGYGNKISFHQLSDLLPSRYLSPQASRPPLMEVSAAAIDLWKQDEMKKTELILSEEISQDDPNHHTLANRALVRARLKQWAAALEDANQSLQLEFSAIGHLAKTMALIGAGEPDLVEFDFVFCVVRNPDDAKFLFVIKAIILFICGRYEEAMRRMRGLIAHADEETKNYCVHILGSMYLKRGNYEAAIQSFQASTSLPPSCESPQLLTISLIFGWNFNGLETVTWARLCQSLYTSGKTKEVGQTLLRMINPLNEDEKESAHCRIIAEIMTLTDDVSLLSWTGQSSTYNSCLPASPAVYTQTLHTSSALEPEKTEARTAELRTSLPQFDALLIHDRVTRLQSVRFTNGHLHLPCLVFRARSLSKKEGGDYHAKVTWLGDVEFATADPLPLDEPRRLVFVHPWTRLLFDPRDENTSEDELEADADADAGSNPNRVSTADSSIGVEIVHAPLVEEAPPAPLDIYTRALQLIARLGQPFNALLLLKQSDGTYKRVAAEHEIVFPGLGSKVPKDIRAEVLEVV